MMRMNTSRCPWTPEQLLLFLAGELEPAEMASARDHLQLCPRCRDYARQLAQTQGRVGAALRATAPAPATLSPRVMAEVRRLSTPESRPISRPLWRSLLQRPRLALAGAGLCLLLGGYIARRVTLTPAPPATTATVAPAPELQLAKLRADYFDWIKRDQAVSVSGGDARTVSTEMVALKKGSCPPVAPVTFRQPDARMTGGCWHQVQGVLLPFLAYSWHGHPVSLYQSDNQKLTLPATMQHQNPNGDRCYQVAQEGGLSYVAWHEGDTRYILVAQVPLEQLLGLARSAQAVSS